MTSGKKRTLDIQPSDDYADSREMCAELIDRLSEQDSCDAAEDYAKHIPARVIACMLPHRQEMPGFAKTINVTP